MLWKLFNPCGKFPNNLEIVQTIYLSPYMSFKWFIINRLMWNKIFPKGSNSANMPAWFFCPSPFLSWCAASTVMLFSKVQGFQC